MNEMIQSKEFLDRITSVVPSKKQLDFQKLEYYNFIHFGLNTFTKKEWGSGNVSPDCFALTDLDTDQWVTELKKTGSKGIIITAKHHDGFCLFPSKFTDYTIASTKYRNGRGDIIKQLSESCKKYDMKLGIYLSPWDRHEKTYGTDKYNDFFVNQLTELCTNYGELFCFWFDGACGEGENGKKQVYDWERYFHTIHTLQPNAVIANCGPDVRWIGNEQGKGRSAEYSVVPKQLQDHLYIASKSQQEDGAKVMTRKMDFTDDILGDREKLVDCELCWYPAEMDVSVTRIGWFWRKSFELFQRRSAKELAQCYYASVGNNGMLLLNVPPNNQGKIPKRYIDRILKAKALIEQRFKNKIEIASRVQDGNIITLTINKSDVKTVVLSEDITKSQRVERFTILCDGKPAFSGRTIGYKKICNFDKPIKSCREVKLIIEQSRKEPYIEKFDLY
ncbi:MAG: alpha-L-fucosidase [Acutalibacteraceae bacterium]